MSGKMSRNKGAVYERHVCKIFSSWWGEKILRVPLSGGWQKERITGDVAGDENFPFSVECKNHEDWHLEELLKSNDCGIRKWWTQCSEDAFKGKVPLLVFTKSYDKDYCMLFRRDFSNIRDNQPFRAMSMGGMVIMIFPEFLCRVNPDLWRKT